MTRHEKSDGADGSDEKNLAKTAEVASRGNGNGNENDVAPGRPPRDNDNGSGEDESKAVGSDEVVSEPRDDNWRQLAVACLGLLALLNGMLAVYAFSSLAEVRRNIDYSLARSEQRYQALDAQIDFDSRRRQLLLNLRDTIATTNPSLDWADAYRYAALAMTAGEKYASVDPVLLVSLGVVESGYNPESRSKGGARGLYQLFPTTGRLLSRALGWEYSESVLTDAAKNTELASLYLETLFAVHDDPRLVLAEYREGALRAGYLRSEVAELDRDGAKFVNDVLELYGRLVSEFGTLRGLDEEPLPLSPEHVEPVSTTVVSGPDGEPRHTDRAR